MPRKPFVTRKLKVTVADVGFIHLSPDGQNDKLYTKEVTVYGNFTDRKKLLNKIKKMYENSVTIASYVIKWRCDELLIGIEPDFFLQNGFVLDKQTRQRITKGE